MRRIWAVYAKKPFGGPAQVLAYLGRYTHRVAIANSRIKALDDDHVAFWKDYRQNGAEKSMRPDEFIRRFLLHTLSDHFHRIRYFGFMTNGHRATPLTKTPSTSDAAVPIAAEPCASSIAFFLHLRDATLPPCHFDATRHETDFDDLSDDLVSLKARHRSPS